METDALNGHSNGIPNLSLDDLLEQRKLLEAEKPTADSDEGDKLPRWKDAIREIDDAISACKSGLLNGAGSDDDNNEHPPGGSPGRQEERQCEPVLSTPYQNLEQTEGYLNSAEPDGMMFERFHVLRGKKLLLYQSESDAKKGSNDVKVVIVEGFGSETKPDVGYVGITLDDSSLYFSIKVVPNVETGHSIIHVVAVDTEQKQRWKRAITQAGRRVSAVPFAEEGGHMVDTGALPGFYQLQREESNEEEYPIASHLVEATDEVLTAMDAAVDEATDALTGRLSPEEKPGR
jgi:hypothetical protein